MTEQTPTPTASLYDALGVLHAARIYGSRRDDLAAVRDHLNAKLIPALLAQLPKPADPEPLDAERLTPHLAADDVVTMRLRRYPHSEPFTVSGKLNSIALKYGMGLQLGGNVVVRSSREPKLGVEILSAPDAECRAAEAERLAAMKAALPEWARDDVAMINAGGVVWSRPSPTGLWSRGYSSLDTDRLVAHVRRYTPQTEEVTVVARFEVAA